MCCGQVVAPELPGRSGKLYKMILCGDASVGKSSFILRLCKNEFRKHTRATLGRSSVTSELFMHIVSVAIS